MPKDCLRPLVPNSHGDRNVIDTWKDIECLSSMEQADRRVYQHVLRLAFPDPKGHRRGRIGEWPTCCSL